MIKVVGTLDFSNNHEFRDFLGKRIAGKGPVYIQIVDNWNNPNSILKSSHFHLNKNTCKVYKEGIYTSLVFDKAKLKEWLNL